MSKSSEIEISKDGLMIMPLKTHSYGLILQIVIAAGAIRHLVSHGETSSSPGALISGN